MEHYSGVHKLIDIAKRRKTSIQPLPRSTLRRVTSGDVKCPIRPCCNGRTLCKKHMRPLVSENYQKLLVQLQHKMLKRELKHMRLAVTERSQVVPA